LGKILVQFRLPDLPWQPSGHGRKYYEGGRVASLDSKPLVINSGKKRAIPYLFLNMISRDIIRSVDMPMDGREA
jgi:hypothetical protein